MKRILFGLCIALLLPALIASQAKPAAVQKVILEFVDGPDLTVTQADKAILKFNAGIFEGDEIPAGSTVTTGPGTTAELRIKPNGSILKLAKATVFKITTIGATSKDKTALELAAGKVRAVAAKGGTYEMKSQTAVCGVRGTDFSFGVEEGAKALLMVTEGLVQFDKIDAAGSILGSLPIAAGQAADAFAATFASFAFDMSQYAEQFGEMVFEKLKVEDVPPTALDEEPEAGPAAGMQAPPEPQEDLSAAEAADLMKVDKETAESGIMKWLRETLGMELGSVTIDGETYAKAVIQPNVNLGKVKFGLYLPIIYTSDLFNPDDWYHPAGNDEWSFGMDQFDNGDYFEGGIDFAKDLALKIKYFEWGRQLIDPFFIKVGNLDDLTLGHGLIMRNYANNTEFPAVRRIGFNLGIDGKGGGFEAIVNDLADPELYALRAFLRPIPSFKLAIGLSAAVDTVPGAVFERTVREGYGDPMFIGTGIDLDLPIVTSGLLSLRLFADAAVTLPYLRNGWTTGPNPVEEGLKYELVFDQDSGEFKNWGAAGGVMGNILFINYRLEYRYFTGVFRPSFFDSTYDRKRGDYVVEYASYLDGTNAYSTTPTVMGVYGEGGFSLMKDKLGLTLGYMMPWSPDQAFEDVAGNDEFHAQLYIRKGLIPIWDAAGSISYDRRGLAKAIADKTFKLLDSNTFFGGEIVIPVPKTPTLDLAITFSTVPVYTYDAEGNISNTAAPEFTPSIGIETRFHL